MSEKLILAIESSGINSGIAIGSESELIFESSLYLKHSHDETLAHQIKQAIELLKIKVDDFEAIAVSSGPGSFTGLRVGGAIAKGLSYGDKPKLIDVPTLSAFAYVSKEFVKSVNARAIFSIIPSNKDNYFVQEFDSNAIEKTTPQLYSIDEIKNLDFVNSVLCGTGAPDFIGNNYQLSGLNRHTPRFILKFAQNKFVKNEFIKSEDFKPQYFQDFVPTKKKNKQ